MITLIISLIPIVLMGGVLFGLSKLGKTTTVAGFLNRKMVVRQGSLVAVGLMTMGLAVLDLADASRLVQYMIVFGTLGSLFVWRDR